MQVPRDVGLPGRRRIPIIGVFAVLFQAFDFPGQVFVVPDPEPTATTMDETLVEGHRQPRMDAVKGSVQFPDIECFHLAAVEHQIQAAYIIRPSAEIGPLVDPGVEEQFQAETVSDGVRRGGFLDPMPQGQMDEFQRGVLALFPIGERADLQPQKLLAQLAHPGGPAVVDVFVLDAEEGRQFPSYAARVSQVQAWSGICPGGVWPGRMAGNRAVRNSRRSLASMSAVLGSVLVVYHGHSMRRLATSAGS